MRASELAVCERHPAGDAGRFEPPRDGVLRADSEETPAVLERFRRADSDGLDIEEVPVAEFEAGGSARHQLPAQIAEPACYDRRLRQRPPDDISGGPDFDADDDGAGRVRPGRNRFSAQHGL